MDFPANHVSLPEAAQELGLTSDAGGVQGHFYGWGWRWLWDVKHRQYREIPPNMLDLKKMILVGIKHEQFGLKHYIT